MKTFFINLSIVYLGGFMFYCAVMLWFNRPNLRRQLAWVTECNDHNVSYSNELNATIRELTDMNNACYLDAVEKDNVISLYDEAAAERRCEVDNLNKELEFLKSELVMAERRSVQQKLENEATVSYYKSQVAGSTRV